MERAEASPQLFFQDWKYLDAHLIWIYEGPPRVQGHLTFVNSYMTAWYLLDGQVDVEIKGRQVITARIGDWILLPPGESTRRFSKTARILSLHFNAQWVNGAQLFDLNGALLVRSSLAEGWLQLCRPMLNWVRDFHPNAYNELPRVPTTFEHYVRLQSDFHKWLGQLLSVLPENGVSICLPNVEDSRALKMIQWLESLPLQSGFRLHVMATVFHLSTTHVNRIFCAEYGITPKRYFEQRRLKCAQVALRSSRQAMKAISYQIGFRHQSEFTAWFKKNTGISPSAYRNGTDF